MPNATNKKQKPKNFLKWNNFFEFLDYDLLYRLWESLYFSTVTEDEKPMLKFFNRLEEYREKEYKDIFEDDKNVAMNNNIKNKNPCLNLNNLVRHNGINTTGIGNTNLRS
jgi:hypothetical protein